MENRQKRRNSLHLEQGRSERRTGSASGAIRDRKCVTGNLCIDNYPNKMYTMGGFDKTRAGLMAQDESTPKQNFRRSRLRGRLRQAAAAHAVPQGRSGNPLGRPKRATDLASLLTRALDRRVTSDDRDAGTQREAIIAALVEKSARRRSARHQAAVRADAADRARRRTRPGLDCTRGRPRAKSCSEGSPASPGIAASPERSKRLGLSSARRFQRSGARSP